MERRIEKATPRPGDRVILASANGTYEVRLVTSSSHEDTLRTLATSALAYEVARSGVAGGGWWWRHHSAQHVTEPYIFLESIEAPRQGIIRFPQSVVH